MSSINLDQLKKLRLETQASIADCRQALEGTDGNFDAAKEWLKKRGLERAEKKKDRETSQGIIDSYIHGNGRVGVITSLTCETDFVARTDEFKKLAHEISMQVAAMNPKNVEALLGQEYIRDSSMKISDLIDHVIGKLGENIKVSGFERMEL